jgi:hypothetical protein
MVLGLAQEGIAKKDDCGEAVGHDSRCGEGRGIEGSLIIEAND